MSLAIDDNLDIMAELAERLCHADSRCNATADADVIWRPPVILNVCVRAIRDDSVFHHTWPYVFVGTLLRAHKAIHNAADMADFYDHPILHPSSSIAI